MHFACTLISSVLRFFVVLLSRELFLKKKSFQMYFVHLFLKFVLDLMELQIFCCCEVFSLQQFNTIISFFSLRFLCLTYVIVYRTMRTFRTPNPYPKRKILIITIEQTFGHTISQYFCTLMFVQTMKKISLRLKLYERKSHIKERRAKKSFFFTYNIYSQLMRFANRISNTKKTQ